MRRFFLCFIIFLSLPGLLLVVEKTLSLNPEKITIYAKDDFKLRKIAENINSWIQTQIFDHYKIASIHLGRNGFMYYLDDTQNALNDLIGKKDFQLLKLWQDFLPKQCVKPFGMDGVSYRLIIAPNKEKIYPSQLRYPLSQYWNDQANADWLIKHLPAECQQNVIYPKTELKKMSDDPAQLWLTYFPTDSHWSYFGAQSIFNLLDWENGKSHLELVMAKPEPAHDLWKILQPVANFLAPTYGTEVFGQTIQYPKDCQAITSDFHNEMFSDLGNPNRKKTVWVVGDSFRLNLVPFVHCYFQHALIVHRMEFAKQRNKMLELYGKPDYVLEVYVERFLNDLPAFLPYVSF